ncbi:MAG: hypothetical protein D6820_03630 [Lentisphaerae bacterium]|nr:MAG: hypothetical protein D6820_03630 [Lentisphaerota bacterium]
MNRFSIVLLISLALRVTLWSDVPERTETAHKGKSAGAKPEETWVYWMAGESKFLKPLPVSDFLVFAAMIDADGQLRLPAVEPEKLREKIGRDIRLHLVVAAPWNPPFLHLLLRRDLSLHTVLERQIGQQFAHWDGIQIDFESMSPADHDAYLEFLRAVKGHCPPGKIFSVAVLPRWNENMLMRNGERDPFDYPAIARIADRVMVMAYDEHPRGGPAGPVASFDWCRNILKFAVKKIPPEKLVMGIPLYGRSWQQPIYNRAWRYREMQEFLKASKLSGKVAYDALNGACLKREERVTVTSWFETLLSVQSKLSLYRQSRLRGVAFWRLGQEPDGLWQRLRRGQSKP